LIRLYQSAIKHSRNVTSELWGLHNRDKKEKKCQLKLYRSTKGKNEKGYRLKKGISKSNNTDVDSPYFFCGRGNGNRALFKQNEIAVIQRLTIMIGSDCLNGKFRIVNSSCATKGLSLLTLF